MVFGGHGIFKLDVATHSNRLKYDFVIAVSVEFKEPRNSITIRRLGFSIYKAKRPRIDQTYTLLSSGFSAGSLRYCKSAVSASFLVVCQR